MTLSPLVVSLRQPPFGMTKATAPGVIGPAQEVSAPPTVSHWFSLARSPCDGAARLAFPLGRLLLNGALSPSGGYEPTTPGAASAFGANGGPRSGLSRFMDSYPRLQLRPEKARQPDELLCSG